MKLPLTITLNAFEMTEQKQVEQLANHIDLHPTYIHWELELIADEPPLNEDGNSDKNMPWERTRTCLVATLKRECLSGVDMMYLKGSKIWKVTIIVPAVEPRFYFKTRTKAEAVASVLRQYIVGEVPKPVDIVQQKAEL